MSTKSNLNFDPYLKLLTKVDVELKNTVGNAIFIGLFGSIPFLGIKFAKMLMKKSEAQEKEMILKEIIKRQSAVQKTLTSQVNIQAGKIK
jgi:hypothetical protein